MTLFVAKVIPVRVATDPGYRQQLPADLRLLCPLTSLLIPSLASPFADCTCSGFNASGSFGTSYIFRKHIEDVNEMA